MHAKKQQQTTERKRRNKNGNRFMDFKNFQICSRESIIALKNSKDEKRNKRMPQILIRNITSSFIYLVFSTRTHTHINENELLHGKNKDKKNNCNTTNVLHKKENNNRRVKSFCTECFVRLRV